MQVRVFRLPDIYQASSRGKRTGKSKENQKWQTLPCLVDQEIFSATQKLNKTKPNEFLWDFFLCRKTFIRQKKVLSARPQSIYVMSRNSSYALSVNLSIETLSVVFVRRETNCFYRLWASVGFNFFILLIIRRYFNS